MQFVGFVPAILALYQLATNTGMDVARNIRANGTFAHPNSAAMFFTIAATASLWLYLDNGHRRFDALLVALFAAALIATFSIDGVITLTVMLTVFGALRPGTVLTKLGPCAIAVVVVLVFFATPARRSPRRRRDVNQHLGRRTRRNDEHARHAPVQVENTPAGVGRIPRLRPRHRHHDHH